MKNSMKSIFIIIAIFLVLILSIIAMIIGLKKSQENPIVETEDRPQIENIEDKENLNQVIENELESEVSIDTTKYICLRQYSENYVSVIDWMLEETIKAMKEFDFSKLEGTQVQVDLTGYDSIEDYVTDKINKNEFDIEQNFMLYCPDLYNDLVNTHLLGKDSNPEYEEGLSSSLYIRLLREYENNNFDEVITSIDEILKTNKLTMPYNYKLCHLYTSAISKKSYYKNEDAIYYGLATIEDVNIFLVDFLDVFDEYKSPMIKDNNSIFPLYSIESTTHIQETTEITTDDLSIEILSLLPNNKQYTDIHKIDFTYSSYQNDVKKILSANLTAYVITYHDNSREILTIEHNGTEGTSCPYFTKEQYIDNITITLDMLNYEPTDTTEDISSEDITEDNNSETTEIEDNNSDSEETIKTEETTETETVNEEEIIEETTE